MSHVPTAAYRDPLRHELSELRGQWIWFLILGIVTIVLGMLVIGVPLMGTLAAVWMLSVLLIAGGIGQLIGAFWARRWSGFFLALLTGILYLAVGILIIDQPFKAAASLTLLVASFLIVGGIFRIVASLTYRFGGWIWPLLNGVISLMLGIFIWRHWPADALWVIGLFVGIEMVLSGWTWVMLALAVRSLLPKA
jgi:uncharacterized membrane protein HdeD (DUF308 family)